MDSDKHESCRERALLLLGRRAHSVGELSRKLCGKGFPPDTVGVVVADLERVGLLNDLDYAIAYCHERLHGSQALGPMRVQAALQRRCVSAETARTAIDRVLSEDDEGSQLKTALEVGKRKWQSLARRTGSTPRRNRDALYRFLAGRGFGGDTIGQAMEQFRGDGASDDG